MFGGKNLEAMQAELEWLDEEIGRWEACLVRCKKAPKGSAAKTADAACRDGLGRLRRMRKKLADRFDRAKDGAKPAAMEKLTGDDADEVDG